jgi:hypothetical protein
VEAESQRAELADRWAIRREGKATRPARPPERGVDYATAVDAMTRLVPDDAVVPVDVGTPPPPSGGTSSRNGSPC